jgi:phage minor structural protein
MICYYNKNEINFSHNGLGVLDNYIINPVVTEELNGIFSFEFDYPITAPHADELLQERIVRCPVPEQPPQLFRISEREANIGGVFRVVAYHIFYDLIQNFVEDTFVVNRNGQEALRQILAATQFPHTFTGYSDILTINSARLVRRNVVEAILNNDLGNSFLSRWGGEILRDNFDVALRRVRGSDNGVLIRDRKNLTGYRSNVDFGTIVTRIMPQGFDGLFLPEKYVDSPLIANYLTPRIRVIKYEQVKAAVGMFADDPDAVPLPEALAMLRKLAAEEYSVHNIDKPTATYSVQFAPLEKTEEYKQFAVLESIAIGDNVNVIHEDDGLNISARMVSYKYNPFTESYIAIILGIFSPKFTDISKTIQRIETDVGQANDNANFALQSANGKNTNFYGSADPENPRFGDLWFKENGEKIEIWIFETREGELQWFPLSTDLTQEQMRIELDAAKILVDEANQKAGEAVQAGENAQAAAEQAKQMGEAAKLAAEEAQKAGDEALVVGNSALQQVQQALSDSAEALAEAGLAAGKADVAISAGQTAQSAASQAAIDAANAINAANTAVGGVNLLTGRVVAAESTITQHTDLINLRVTKGEIINQINISPESILIAGSRIHITGQTTINNGVIQTAMIADAAITNAKIATLDAAKITTGTLSADRIAAGSIASSKLTIANGFIQTAMIADLGVSTAKIADLAVSTAKIAALAVTEAKIGNLAVSTAKIQNAAITSAKIGTAQIGDAHIINISADKIFTGFIAAERIAAGSITSDKLTIANGFIVNAMIADATIQNAKIATLDAAKITTGTLAAARIAAGTITGNHLATNAIQVGLAGWNQSIRINPTNINWFNGNDLQGMLTADGLGFYQTTSRFIGRFAGSFDAVDNNIRGVSMHLNGQGDYLSWGARTGTSGTFTSFLILDPYGKLDGTAGLHLGTHLRTKGYNFYSPGNRITKMTDLTLTVGGVSTGPFPAWGGDNGRSRVCFGTDHLYLVSNNVFSTVTALTARMSELITRVNGLITRLNNTGYQSGVNSTNLTTMGTSLTVP